MSLSSSNASLAEVELGGGFRSYSLGHDVTFSSSVALPAVDDLTSTLPRTDVSDQKTTVRVEESSSATPESKAVQAESEQAKAFRQGLEDILDAEVVEAGIKSLAERYVDSWLKVDKFLVLLEFGRLCLGSTGNPKRLVGILNIIAHVNRDEFSPINELITLSCLASSSVEVKEFAIGVYEYWGDPESAKKLMDYQMTPQWLDDYRKEVISELCGEG